MKRQLSILLAGPSLLVLATAAVAQPAATTPPILDKPADPDTQALEVNEADEATGSDGAIIITARRRAESLLDVPQTVSAVTGQQIQQFNILKFQDISTLVPGLNLTTDNSGFGATAQTRGVSFQVSSQGTPSTETYFNELPVEPNLMFQGNFDVGQIEVLKGPQGVQRGRSAPSGAITVSTRRPDLNEFGGTVGMVGNSHGGINLQAAVGGPIIQDVLGFRVAGLLDNNDQGGVKSVNNPSDPYGHTWAYRGSLRFEPNDDISAVVMYQNMHLHTSTFGGSLFGPGASGVFTQATANNPRISAPAGFNGPPLGNIGDPLVINGVTILTNGANVSPDPDHRRSISDFPTLVFQTFQVLSGQFDWRFAGQKLGYVGGWSKEFLDNTGGGADASNTIVGRQVSLLAGTLSTEKRFTNELRLSSDERIGGIFDYTAGVYRGKIWGLTENTSNAVQFPGAFGSPLGTGSPAGPNAVGTLSPFTFDSRYAVNLTSSTPRKNIEKAIFADVIAHLFDDKLELEAGARQIWYAATKAVNPRYGLGLYAATNPNGLGACPAQLSGVNAALGAPFTNAPVVGSSFPGTCDVQLSGPSRDSDGNLVSAANGIPQLLPPVPEGTRKWSPFVWKLSASYHISPDLMVYTTAGTSWRAGPGPITGVPVCAAQNTPGFPNPGACDFINFLDPETSKSYEVGFKGAFFEHKVSFAVSAYHQKYDGLIVFSNGNSYLGGPCAFPSTSVQPATCRPSQSQMTFNAPAKVKGIDMDINVRLNEDLNFGGAFSWSKGRYSNANIPCRDTNFDGVPDNLPLPQTAAGWFAAAAAANGGVVPNSAYGVSLCPSDGASTTSPPWNFNLRGEYSHPLFTGGKGFIRALFNYVPKNTNLDASTLLIPDRYTTLSLWLGIRGENDAWEVSVSARNLLNNQDILSIGGQDSTLAQPPVRLSFAPPAGVGSIANDAGYRTVSYVERREFAVNFRYSFGSR